MPSENHFPLIDRRIRFYVNCKSLKVVPDKTFHAARVASASIVFEIILYDVAAAMLKWTKYGRRVRTSGGDGNGDENMKRCQFAGAALIF